MFRFWLPFCIVLFTGITTTILPVKAHEVTLTPIDGKVELANEGDVHLVLLGVVYHETSMLPVSDLTIQLVDVFEEQTESFVSRPNGQFHFHLRSDRLYKVNLYDNDGRLISSKDLSTINRREPELLRIVLTMPSNKNANPQEFVGF